MRTRQIITAPATVRDCARLLEQGGHTLLDHELIEYLPALAIPRKDTKPLATQLLGHYGDLSAFLTAGAENIARQLRMGETSTTALNIVQAAALRLLSAAVREQPVLASWQSLLDYLRADMAHLTIERARTLHLNSKTCSFAMRWPANARSIKRRFTRAKSFAER